MPDCPDCGAPTTPGEPFCLECGGDLSPVAPPAEAAAPEAGPRYFCDPDREVEGFAGCGHTGEFLPGNTCPICGARWDEPVTAAEAPSAAGPGSASEVEHTPPPASGGPLLRVAGGQRVLHRGRWISELAFDTDEISVGCRDIHADHYPDLDLLAFRQADPYLSRRHARFLREGGHYYLEILTDADSTTLNGPDEVLHRGERRELGPGDRVFFSDSVVVEFVG